MTAEKTLWGLYVESVIWKERQKGIWRLGKTWKRDSSTWPSPGNHRRGTITSSSGFYFQRKLKASRGPWLCCALAQSRSPLDCNAATPYARAPSQCNNTVLLVWWKETRGEVLITWAAGYVHSLLPAAVWARCHSCCYKTLGTKHSVSLFYQSNTLGISLCV